jgi:hypothetical protein
MIHSLQATERAAQGLMAVEDLGIPGTDLRGVQRSRQAGGWSNQRRLASEKLRFVVLGLRLLLGKENLRFSGTRSRLAHYKYFS